jgi:hypothetical protein
MKIFVKTERANFTSMRIIPICNGKTHPCCLLDPCKIFQCPKIEHRPASQYGRGFQDLFKDLSTALTTDHRGNFSASIALSGTTFACPDYQQRPVRVPPPEWEGDSTQVFARDSRFHHHVFTLAT